MESFILAHSTRSKNTPDSKYQATSVLPWSLSFIYHISWKECSHHAEFRWVESDWGERTEAQSLECCSGQQSAALKRHSNVLAAGWAKSQRWDMATWNKNTKLPFKVANPFFTSSQKPPSLPLNSTAKSARSCFLSWEDGTQTEGAVEKGVGATACQSNISGEGG